MKENFGVGWAAAGSSRPDGSDRVEFHSVCGKKSSEAGGKGIL